MAYIYIYYLYIYISIVWVNIYSYIMLYLLTVNITKTIAGIKMGDMFRYVKLPEGNFYGKIRK